MEPMKTGPTKHKYRIPAAGFTILGGLLLMVYIISLLVVFYRNNSALQQSSLNRFQLDVANKAATIEYYFLERKYDIRNLADSLEVNTYFTNRNMGMSEQYGLKVSLFSIQQIIKKTIREKNIGNNTIYKKIAFLDQDKKILATCSSLGSSTSSKPIPWGKKLDDIQDEPEVIIKTTDGRHEILLAAPCLVKKQVTGWIIAWLNPDTLYNEFIVSSAISHKMFNLTLADGTILNLSDKNRPSFPWKKYRKKIAQIIQPVLLPVKNEKGKTDHLLFTREKISPFPFFLTAYIHPDKIFGSISAWQFLTGAAAMVLLILASLLWSTHANIKHIILKTRFEESKKQQNILTEKNSQLREEIRKRKTAESFLIENEERYRKLFEFSSDAILIMRDSKIITCNQKTAELLKLDRSEILNKNFFSFSPENQPDGILSRIQCSELRQQALLKPQHFEWILKTADGNLIDTEITMTAINLKSDMVLQVLIRDITERKRTREILIQTEKMMAVGGLAAGMAHEINNPLGVILQACQNIVRRLGTTLKKNRELARSLELDLDCMQQYLEERSIYNYLNSIQSAGERAAKIVKSMLDFGRSSKNAEKELYDINTILNNTLTIAASDYDLKKTYDFKKITIHRHFGELEKVYCAGTEIGQVFLNIIKNAAQAMSTGGFTGEHPEITVITKQEHDWVTVTISDNGPGINPAIQKVIFEPFFTTKPVGEGTGLGLSVSYFIITSHHNGRIDVSSEPGQGASFTIRLPLENTLPEQSMQPEKTA